MGNGVPGIFIWEPEKSAPTILNLRMAIGKSINIREKNI
jgi:hypothetical protein